MTEYASPVLRAASPASSVGTVYGPDQTSFSDSDLSPFRFQVKYDAQIGLGEPRREEVLANLDPLLPPAKNEAEEKSESRPRSARAAERSRGRPVRKDHNVAAQ